MRKDEYSLTKELRRLEKYGLLLQAKRVGYSKEGDSVYNILFTEDKRVLEPECSVSEVMGIINSVDTCLELFASKLKENSNDFTDTQRMIDERKESKVQVLTDKGRELFDQLRALRLQISREEGLPPYTIFTDRALEDMCFKLPDDDNEMLNVHGVGENNYAKHGRPFLDKIKAFKADYPGVNTSETEDVDDYDVILPASKSTKKSKGPKADFYLLRQDCERFIYKDLYTLSEIKDELNRICSADNAKKISGTKIFAYLESKGLVEELFENGVHSKVETPKGKEIGIVSNERISQAGTRYFVLMYPRAVQEMLLDYYTGFEKGDK